jgi:D-alanyl-D-alanine carboxypeptidase (penicillin-binding protein 5/6)
MIEFSFSQKILTNFVLLSVRFLNFVNFELRWLLFASFTIFITLSLWNIKDSNLEDYMKLTRRKPVLSLSETIPESIINKKDFEEKNLVLSKETRDITVPSEKVLKIKPVSLNAKSFLVYDLNKSLELVSYNKTEMLPPASLVKILSVMYFSRDLNLNSKYKMTQECTFVNGQKVGFKAGEEVSVKDLIYSSLIFSGADSVCLLSRINTNLDIQGFNDYAKSIGVKNSNFTNYIGLDYTNNYTTSEDMLIITREFLKNDLFSEIVKIKSFTLENKKVIYNTNKMLFSEKFSAGVKTGTTDGANENLIYRYKDDSSKIDVLVVILNSDNRYLDTQKIISSLYKE